MRLWSSNEADCKYPFDSKWREKMEIKESIGLKNGDSNRGAVIEVAGIGACVADMLYTVPNFPKEDTKLRATESMMAGGGPTATGLVAASKLGCKSAYLGVLSTDASGAFLMEDFVRYGVDTKGIVTYDSSYRSFSSCIWLNAQTGSRTCVFDKGNLPAYELTEKACEILKEASILMVDGNELSAAIAGADYIHQYGGKVLYDAGGRYPGVENLLPKADVLIPSAEFALGHTGAQTIEEAAVKLYEAYHPEIVVITDGKNGGILYQGEEVRHYPAFPVKVADSNGAGDVFHGAFAAAMQKGFSYMECCVFSSMVSALKCTGVGARKSIPDYETVMTELEKRR